MAGYELAGRDPCPRTYEDEELDAETDCMPNQPDLVVEVNVPAIAAQVLLVATTNAAACFLRSFVRGADTTVLATIRFQEAKTGSVGEIWSAAAHPDLLFATLEAPVPAERALEWADMLLQTVDVQSVVALHSMRPLECDRWTDAIQLEKLETDHFQGWRGERGASIPSLRTPYTISGEAAAVLTRCQVLRRPAAIFVGWEMEPTFGLELMESFEAAMHVATGENCPDLKSDYLTQITQHSQAPDHYIYS